MSYVAGGWCVFMLIYLACCKPDAVVESPSQIGNTGEEKEEELEDKDCSAEKRGVYYKNVDLDESVSVNNVVIDTNKENTENTEDA